MISGRVYARLEDFQPALARGAPPPRHRPPIPWLNGLSINLCGLTLPASVALHRAAMCTLAVALLWTTSLAAARSLANTFVTSPTVSAVVHECRRTYNEVHRQRDAHLACVRRQADVCASSLLAALEEETARSHAAASANRRFVAAALVRTERCAHGRLQALEGVQRLQSIGIALTWRAEGEQCSASDAVRARAIVGDISAARGHAMDVATRYSANAQMLQSLGLAHIDSSQRYDAAYLAEKRQTLKALPAQLEAVTQAKAARVQETLARLNSTMRACVDGGASDVCELPLQSQIEQMRSQYDALMTAMRQQQRELINFHDAMDSMVGTIRPALDAVSRLARQIDPHIHLPSMDVPDVHLPEVHLPPLPSIDELRVELASYTARQQVEAQGYLSDVRGTTDEWESELKRYTGGVGGLLDDFTPPPFNTSAARTVMEGESARFLHEQRQALSAFATQSTLSREANSTHGLGNESLSALGGGMSGWLERSGLRYEPLASTNVDIDYLSLAVGHLAWLATACDCTWRVWLSVRLVLKYWSKASVGLPVLDLRNDQRSGQAVDVCAQLGKDPSRCVTACCLSPLTGGTIVLAALFLLFNAATALYIPTYLHYVDGCIAPPRNGTLLSNNLFSVSYNFAAQEGNQRLIRTLDLNLARRAANCSAEVRTSAVRQRANERDARRAREAYEAARADVRLMRDCMWLERLDEAAAAARVEPYVPLRAVLAPDVCGNAEGVDGDGNADLGGGALAPRQRRVLTDASVVRGAPSSSPPPRAGDAPAIDASALGLQNGVYNCSAVGECVSACDGPSREVTATLAQQCGCHAEWLTHGIILHVLLALLVYALINASRLLTVDASCRLLWRELFAGQFEFLANCDDGGNASVGRAQILGALREAVGAHARSGWLLLIAAGAINVPWVVVLHYVGDHLDVGHSAAAPGALS